jgi:hypothetical protein
MAKRKAAASKPSAAGPKRRKKAEEEEDTSDSECSNEDNVDEMFEQSSSEEEMDEEEADEDMANFYRAQNYSSGCGLSQDDCLRYRSIQMRRKALLLSKLKEIQALRLQRRKAEEEDIGRWNEKYDILRGEWDGGYRAELEVRKLS